MAVDVGSGERCGRVVIHHNDVGACTGNEPADGVAEAGAGQIRVAVKEHGRRFGPTCGGVARLVLVEEVGYLERLEHVARVAIAAQAEANAAVDHSENRRATHGITHIGFGVVDHVGLAALQQCYLAIVHMNAMRGDGLVAENAPVVEPLDDALAMLALALGYIRGGLRDMDVETCIELRGYAGALGEGMVAESEGGVETEESAEQAATGTPARFKKGAILFDTLARDLIAFAIRDLVAEATAQTCEVGRVCDAE